MLEDFSESCRQHSWEFSEIIVNVTEGYSLDLIKPEKFRKKYEKKNIKTLR